MRLFVLCLLCLLMDSLLLPDADCRTLEQSMEVRNPDIDPSWYTGRGIRPVGRFGRRRAAAGENVQKSDLQPRQGCFPIGNRDGQLQGE